MNVLIKILAMTFVASTGALAQEDGKTDASAFLQEENCASGLNSPDCRMLFSVSGKTAETLFKGMKARAIKDECVEGEAKEDKSGLRCYRNGDGEYSCDFGYSFVKQSFGNSEVPC
jgi:hypothetical protein